MHQRLKAKLYPTQKQKQMLEQHFDGYRFAYNLCLSYKSLLWKDYGKNVSGFNMQNELFEIRNETEWLAKCKAECVRDAALNVETAYKNFFKGNGFPKYKSKKGVQSFHAYQSINCKDSRVKFFGHRIKFKTSEEYNQLLETHSIKQVTFKKDLCGDYWATFLIDTHGDKILPKTNSSIGIDLGIKDLVITSEGQVFENKKHLKRMCFKLIKLQRQHSKTKKGGKNREKLRIKIAKIHRKIRFQKKHYYYQITNQLLRDNQTIVIETLNVKGMMANRKLARVISDASWGMLIQMFDYKAAWYGREIIKISTFFPSSKTCSGCGNIKTKLKLSERTYDCECCGLSIDRDLNAAINIKKAGLKIPGVPVENIAKASSKKQEVKIY